MSETAVPLSPAELDRFAEDYYLNEAVVDIDIEELAQEHSIPAIVKAIGSAARVLEMGFGTGLITRKLLEAGIQVEVVEGSPTLCDQARHRHPGLVVHEAMFEEFQPLEPYDAVLCLHVLEHVDEPVQVAAEFATWLVPGGRLVAVTPNAGSIHRHVAVRMGLHDNLDDLSERDHLVGHKRVFTLDQLAGVLEAAGLQVTDRFGYFVKPLSNGQMLGWELAMLEAFNAISDVVPAELLANIGITATRPEI